MGPRRRLAGRIAPFAAGVLLGFVVLPIGNQVNWLLYAIAAVVTTSVLAAIVLAPWPGLPDWTRSFTALIFVAGIALLRESGGGTSSGVGTLALLPVFWLALSGTRRQLLVIVAGVWAFFLVPILVIGGAHYPSTGWRSSVVFAAVALFIGLTTQRLVAVERDHARDLLARERDLESVAELSRSLLASSDARHDICAAVCDLSGAYFAVLLEPAPDGALVTTAAAGFALPSMHVARDDPSWVMAAYRARASTFADPHGRIDGHTDMYEAAGRPAAVLVQPVLRGDEATGVVIIGWREALSDATRVTGLVRTLAAEAAFAIERSDLLGRLTAVAATDALTGLPNRRSWDEHIGAAIEADEPFCVAIVDLDLFKAFNDERGHQAGDELLEAAAEAWRATLRPTDVLARYGGEEFVVLLHGCTIDAARPVIERLRAATPLGQSCSAGIAARRDGEDAATLVGRADEALYAAKAAGRDQLLAA